MEPTTLALAGGTIVGGSTSVLLAVLGRTEGVSGMAGGLLAGPPADRLLRAAFLAGLAAGGLAAFRVTPSAFLDTSGRPLGAFLIAGLLVGYGARLANGCTSGHGVLGVSRRSMRSLAAIAMFVAFAALTSAAWRALGGAS